jgi:hypothetical protein
MLKISSNKIVERAKTPVSAITVNQNIKQSFKILSASNSSDTSTKILSAISNALNLKTIL